VPPSFAAPTAVLEMQSPLELELQPPPPPDAVTAGRENSQMPPRPAQTVPCSVLYYVLLGCNGAQGPTELKP
jgi:hypothetical protein